MRVDHRAELDLLDLDDLLLLAGFGCLLLLLVLVFAKIENLGNRRLGIRRDFAEIETSLFGQTQGFADRDNTAVFTSGIDQADVRDVDLKIDPRTIGFRCRRGIERGTGYDALLKQLQG
jgi:hypothetical protein